MAVNYKKMAKTGNYVIGILDSGTVEVTRNYGSSDEVKADNVKETLREISEQIGFSYDPEWNTRTFGSKLIDFINSNRKDKSSNVIGRFIAIVAVVVIVAIVIGYFVLTKM